MKIISFTEKYQQQVIEHILAIQVNEFGVDISLEAQPDLLQIQQCYQDNGGDFWLAIDDSDNVIGTIALLVLDEKISSIRKMFVKKEYRSSGVAQQLLNTLLQYATDKGGQEIYLGTVGDKFKAAIKFYTKNDFIEIESQELPDIFPLMGTDNTFFKYHIK